jgi:hypothetical protein
VRRSVIDARAIGECVFLENVRPILIDRDLAGCSVATTFIDDDDDDDITSMLASVADSLEK